MKPEDKKKLKSTVKIIGAIVLVSWVFVMCAMLMNQDDLGIQHEVLKEEITDRPGVTRINLDLLVTGDITRESLDRFLKKLYEKQKSRTGFKYRRNPDSIWFYAYQSRAHLNSGTGQWLAMLSKRPEESGPSISFNDLAIKALTLPKETRFGLSEDERLEIYRDAVREEDRARVETEKAFPTTLPGTTAEDLRKSFDHADKLREEYLSELAKKSGLTDDELSKISEEAFNENWPLPPG